MSEELTKLRQNSSDNIIFNSLIRDNDDFRQKVERVKAANPNMGALEEYNFPKAMLDIHFGAKRDPVNEKLSRSASRAMNTAREKSYSQELLQDPLVFAGKTAANIPSSAIEIVKGLTSAVQHPIQTGKALLQIGTGGAANTLETIADLAGVKNAEDIFDLESEEIANAVGNFYAKRYGSLDDAAKTLQEDPVGFLSDFSTVVTGVGGLIKGTALATGQATGLAVRGASPITTAGKAIRGVENIGTSLAIKGIKAEPIVIAGRGAFIAGKAVKRAASVGKNAEALVSSAIKLHPSKTRRFMLPNISNGKTPAAYILEKGISGNADDIVMQLEKIADKSKAVVDSELASVTHTFDVIDDIPRIKDALKALGKELDEVGLEVKANRVAELAAKDRLNLSEINEVKRMMDKEIRIFNRSGTPKDVKAAEGLAVVRDDIKTFIEKTADEFGLQDIKVLNKDTQLSFRLADDISESLTSKFGNNILTLGDFMAGGIGGAATGFDPLTTAGIVVARRVLGSIRFKTTFAKYLNRLSPSELKILQKLKTSGKHTKESRRITRKVVAQTAEDMKQRSIADQERQLLSLNTEI